MNLKIINIKTHTKHYEEWNAEKKNDLNTYASVDVEIVVHPS